MILNMYTSRLNAREGIRRRLDSSPGFDTSGIVFGADSMYFNAHNPPLSENLGVLAIPGERNPVTGTTTRDILE